MKNKIRRFPRKNPVVSARRILDLLITVIGPTKTWPGRCFEIASRAVEAGVPGNAVYGHWLGPVAEGTLFEGRDRAGFVRHGWIAQPNGRVIDPTRWCFEGIAPYIYVGQNDHYDMGGNQFRRAMRHPPPEWDPTEKQYYFDGPSDAWAFVEKILNLQEVLEEPAYKPGNMTEEQVCWLANLDLQTLGPHAKEVFAFITRKGREALIPIDNRRHVLGSTV